jgi:hypothetical protein
MATEGEDVSLNKPLLQILQLFKTWFSTRSETKAGRIEAVSMLGICLARAYEVSLTTRAVGILDATLNSRNVAAFKTGLVRIVFINLGGAILRIAYSYLQARLTWKWCVFTSFHVISHISHQ